MITETNKNYLDSLFEDYDGDDDPKEFSWDDASPVGNELW